MKGKKGKGKLTERRRLPNLCKWNIADSLDELEQARALLTDIIQQVSGDESLRKLGYVKDLLWQIQIRLTEIKPEEREDKRQ